MRELLTVNIVDLLCCARIMPELHEDRRRSDGARQSVSQLVDRSGGQSIGYPSLFPFLKQKLCANRKLNRCEVEDARRGK